MGSKNRFFHTPTFERCTRCRLRQRLCICSLLSHLKLQTRVSLIVHGREIHKPTNSGRLLTLLLENSDLRIRGGKYREFSSQGLVRPEYENFVFYPSYGAIQLNKHFVNNFTKPLNLIVPDGNWRQASRMVRRIDEIRKLPKVMLSHGQETHYRLRKETRDNGLATLESVARALAIVENEEVGESLEEAFRLMVERILWTRGKLHADEVFGGIPESALREHAWLSDPNRNPNQPPP